jgi:hypothetical protein
LEQGNIKVKEIYYAKEQKTYVYHTEYTDSASYQGTKESVIQQFRKEMLDKYNFKEAHQIKNILFKKWL